MIYLSVGARPGWTLDSVLLCRAVDERSRCGGLVSTSLSLTFFLDLDVTKCGAKDSNFRSALGRPTKKSTAECREITIFYGLLAPFAL